MGKRWEVSLMLPGELWVLLGDGNSADSLAATQLLLALSRGRRQSLWGRALKSEHGKTHFLCNLTSQQVQSLRHRQKGIRSPKPGS